MPIDPAVQLFADKSAKVSDPLARIGAWAAIAIVLLMVIHTAVFVVWPPPGFTPTLENTRGWFELFQSRPVVALVNLDVLMLIDFACVLLVFIGIGSLLWRSQPGLVLIAVVFSAVSAAVYFASNPAFTMQALAHGFHSGTDAASYLAAGQATLAIYHGTPFDVGYVLSAIAGLLLTTAMLRSSHFSRATVLVGFPMFLLNLVPPTVGAIGLVMSVASLPLLVLWLIFVARRLLRA